MVTPDASNYNASPEYIRKLVEAAQQRHSLSQRKVADLIGVGRTTLMDWMAGKSRWPYHAQYALEALSRSEIKNEVA